MSQNKSLVINMPQMMWVLNAEHSFNNTDHFKILVCWSKDRKFYEGRSAATHLLKFAAQVS